MTKIIISDTHSVSIGFSDEWLYMSLADGRYQGYISRLAYLYREKYRSNTSKLSNFEKILKLINSQDSLRGYRFEAKREKLFYTITHGDNYKRIGVEFVNKFLKSDLYNFNGISSESEIYYYRTIQGAYELTDKISISFPDFIENILSKTKDDMIDRFGVSYIINYMLNTQPRKLDFLINEVK